MVRRPMLLTLILALAATTSGRAEDAPLVGVWRLNVRESRAVLGAPPTAQVNTISVAAPDGINFVTERTDSSGAPRRAEFTAQFDGKTYPYRPAQDWRDGVRVNRIDPNTYEIHWRKGSETTGINYWVLSEGGRRLTWISLGLENSTQVYNRVAVFDKQADTP